MATEASSSLLTLTNIAGALVTYWAAATLYNLINAPQPPTSIPWQGYGKGWIAGARNFLALSKSKEWLLSGYERYTKNNKVFVLPPTLGMQAEVVMPSSQLRWMFDQPDSVLSTSQAHYDFLQGDYAFVSPAILRDPYHEHVSVIKYHMFLLADIYVKVIHKCLVRNLNAVIPDLAEEVPIAVDRIFGTDTENFVKREVMDSFMRMIPSITNRLLVGKKLAHEQKFLDAALGFTMNVIRIQSSIFLFPKALHPLLGNILGLISKYHFWISSRFTVPLIRKRIEDLDKQEAGDPEYKSWKAPHDFLTWSIQTARAENRPEEMDPHRIAARVMPLNFAAIHTTSLTGYESLTSILSADPSVLESLREEAYRVLTEDGSWSKAGLSRMHRMDSAIRESQRAAPIALTFIHRKVVAKDGIVTPEGVHVKCGTLLSCPWTGFALDSELHGEDADKFDAFRYSRPIEAYEAMTPEEKEKTDMLKLKQSGIVTTSINHLPFGHGRHAWYVSPILQTSLM